MFTRLAAASIVLAGVSLGAQSASVPKFDRVLFLETTAEDSANVHVGDVNGDGRLDIAAARSGAANVVYFGS